MGICENCEHRDNPVGYCIDRKYTVIRNKRGGIISKEVPRIICHKLKEQLPPEYIKDKFSQRINNEQNAEYISKGLEEQFKNYNSFYKIAVKCVSPEKERQIIQKLEEDYFDRWIGISAILERGHRIPFTFSLNTERVHKTRIALTEEDKKAIQNNPLIKEIATLEQVNSITCDNMSQQAKIEGVSRQAIHRRRQRLKKKLEKRGGLTFRLYSEEM